MADSHAQIRQDFIKRLFAVAISVGFATSLVSLSSGWLNDNPRWPTPPEWQQLILLITALAATVLSWDGYLLSIQKRPHKGFWRYIIDISLVLTYMILLITSKNSAIFMWILAVIFLLYFVWDTLTVGEYIGTYNKSIKHHHKATPRQVWSIYWGGLVRSRNIGRGPIITFIWAFYFWVLMWMSYKSQVRQFHVILVCLLSLYGLCLYRLEKTKSISERTVVSGHTVVSHRTVGFGITNELFFIILGLVGAFSVFYVQRV